MTTPKTTSITTEPRQTKTCRQTTELLPWLLSGSLDEAEKQRVLDHLSSCESCRVELEETAAVWEMFDRHVPSLALAEYAQGLAPCGMDRAQIERHLALCPSCRQEMEGAMPGQVADLEAERAVRFKKTPRRRPGRVPAWRRLAIAAGLVVTLTSFGLIWSLSELQPPQVADGVAIQPGLEAPAGPDDAPGAVLQTDVLVFGDGFESGTVVAWTVSQ